MIYNMERIDRVIDKIIRDLGLGQNEIDYADYIEWMADGLQHIGAYYQYEEKECSVIIDDYTGLLPCDLHKVIRMKKGCSITPSGEGGFYGGSLTQALVNAGVDFDTLSALDNYAIAKTQGLQGINYTSGYSYITDKLQGNKNLIGTSSANSFTENDYNVNFNKVTTAFRHGVIQLQYLALPIDERGWPLVPDNVSFRDALFWKVAYHVSMRDPKSLASPRMQDMEYCRQQWLKYCKQARAEANMPDLAMTERLANNWMRLYNTTNDGANEYRNLGKQQNINLNGY